MASTQPQLHRANRLHSALAIEHNSLSLNQITALLNSKHMLTPQQEVLEAQNAYDLLPVLNPYFIDNLSKIHHVMTEELVPSVGRFLNQRVGVHSGGQLIHTGTPVQYVPETMQQLFGNQILA